MTEYMKHADRHLNLNGDDGAFGVVTYSVLLFDEIGRSGRVPFYCEVLDDRRLTGRAEVISATP